MPIAFANSSRQSKTLDSLVLYVSSEVDMGSDSMTSGSDEQYDEQDSSSSVDDEHVEDVATELVA